MVLQVGGYRDMISYVLVKWMRVGALFKIPAQD